MSKKYVELLKTVVVFIVTFLVAIVFLHFFRFSVVDGNSMNPTFKDKDQIMVLYTDTLQVNDVAILWSDELDEYVIKRVIGCSGDHIQISDGKLYRNGARLYETYILEQNWTSDNCDLIVPDDCYFVLGDNRNNSIDSRVLGTFDKSDVYGRFIVKLPF